MCIYTTTKKCIHLCFLFFLTDPKYTKPRWDILLGALLCLADFPMSMVSELLLETQG